MLVCRISPLCRKLVQCSEFTAALVDEFLAQLVVGLVVLADN